MTIDMRHSGHGKESSFSIHNGLEPIRRHHLQSGDGDTIWYRGNNIRIADIDTPETHSPRCDEEAQLGGEATDRLQDLMNAGAFSVQTIDRDTDVYGRQLRVLTRGGESIGGMLVDEGLARYYGSGRQSWC